MQPHNEYHAGGFYCQLLLGKTLLPTSIELGTVFAGRFKRCSVGPPDSGNRVCGVQVCRFIRCKFIFALIFTGFMRFSASALSRPEMCQQSKRVRWQRGAGVSAKKNPKPVKAGGRQFRPRSPDFASHVRNGARDCRPHLELGRNREPVSL